MIIQIIMFLRIHSCLKGRASRITDGSHRKSVIPVRIVRRTYVQITVIQSIGIIHPFCRYIKHRRTHLQTHLFRQTVLNNSRYGRPLTCYRRFPFYNGRDCHKIIHGTFPLIVFRQILILLLKVVQHLLDQILRISAAVNFISIRIQESFQLIFDSVLLRQILDPAVGILAGILHSSDEIIRFENIFIFQMLRHHIDGVTFRKCYIHNLLRKCPLSCLFFLLRFIAQSKMDSCSSGCDHDHKNDQSDDQRFFRTPSMILFPAFSSPLRVFIEI